MERTKDLFADQQEPMTDAEIARMNADQELQYLADQEKTLEAAAAQKLPVIDLNDLKPEQETSNMVFENGGTIETVDLTSMVIADKIVNAIIAGHLNPLEFYVKKKLVEDALKIVCKNPDVKELAHSEVAKYGKDGAKLLGATITAGSRRTYNYSLDPTWASLNAQAKPYIDLMKAQEKLVQAAVKQGKSFEEVDKDSGEIKTIAACVPAPATDFISVSFKKK